MKQPEPLTFGLVEELSDILAEAKMLIERFRVNGKTPLAFQKLERAIERFEEE